MSARIHAFGIFLTCLVLPTIALTDQHIVFKDSFEDCLVEPLTSWSGGGDGVTWSDPLNWKGGQVPADGDGVRINVVGEITVNFDNLAGTVNIQCIQSRESLLISGGTLNIAALSSIKGDLTIQTGTVSVADKLTVSGAMLQSSGGMSGTGIVTVHGLFSWTGGAQFGTGETVAAIRMALFARPDLCH